MIVLTFLMGAGALMSTVLPNTHEVDADIAKWILCRDEVGEKLYNLNHSDYLQYMYQSKSAAASVNNVDFFLNKILAVSGFDFVEVNESILGRPLRPESIPEVNSEDANAKAPKVSAFDRFGVAGLNWSTYMGEWKYYQIDACNGTEVSTVRYGDFYSGRLEPKSSFDEVSGSLDYRSLQFAGTRDGDRLRSVSGDKLANFLFTISKLIITLTIAFVGLAFTDITTLLGFGVSGSTSGGTAVGVFNTLFNTIFTSFIVISFLLTAIYIIYHGLVKRQSRFALNTFVKTVAIFIVAIVIATNPSYWISAPNKITTYGQAVVLSSMTGLFEDKPGTQASLCGSDVGSIYNEVGLSEVANETKVIDELEQVSINMRSMIGCKMWEQFLFKPWARGQFGADYKELNDSALNNINSDWTGDAAVPLGNGQYINNWALFQLSTQTNAHAQIGETNFPTYVNGVNADWWRVVDTLSNYDEHEDKTTSSLIGGDNVEVEHMSVVESEPLEFWGNWVGNNTVDRSSSAFIAIVFGLLGSIVPLSFALSSAVFGLGITLLMMISPLFLLLGTWGGRGESIFKGWLSALANTVIKRIAVSMLLVVSISITLSVMDLIYEIGVVRSFILLVIITLILIKNKKRLLDMFASIDFGGAFDPRRGFNNVMDRYNRRARDTGNMAMAAGAGAVAAKRSGRSMLTGAKIGARHQTRNLLYKSEMGRHASMAYDTGKGSTLARGYNCNVCFRKFDSEDDGDVIVFRDEYGNYYCQDCADEMGTEELYEVILTGDDSKGDLSESSIIYVDAKNHDNELTEEQILGKVEGVDYIKKNVVVRPGSDIKNTRQMAATNNMSMLSNSNVRNIMKPTYNYGVLEWDEKAVKDMIRHNIHNLTRDMILFTNISHKLGIAAAPPSIPEPLHEYIDLVAMNQAWTDGAHDYIEKTYKAAWKMWHEENAKHLQDYDEDSVLEFQDEIDELEFDVGVEELKEMLDKFNNNYSDADKIRMDFESDAYIMKNGKLVFNKFNE